MRLRLIVAPGSASYSTRPFIHTLVNRGRGNPKTFGVGLDFPPSILLWTHYLLEADCRGWTICIVKTCHSLHGCCGSGSYHHHRHHRRHHDEDHHDIIIVVVKIITTWGCTSLPVADAISSWFDFYFKIKTSILFRGVELEARPSQNDYLACCIKINIC